VLHDRAEDYAQSVAFYRLPAAQGLDGAQYQLGIMYYNGFGVVLDDAEALRWHHIAAAQGYPEAFFSVAVNHEGNDVDNVGDATVEAIGWYRRAQAAGDSFAAEELQRLKKNSCIGKLAPQFCCVAILAIAIGAACQKGDRWMKRCRVNMVLTRH
jgi:TPR repeat protein